MNSNFAVAAYVVFAAVLAWDYLAPRFKLARVRRAISQRARRDSQRKPA